MWPQVQVRRVGSLWWLWTCYPRYRACESVSPWRLDVWPQEKGLECGVTIETVDVCLQLQGLGGGNPGDCGNLTSGGGTVRCCHPRDWGRVTPGSESGRGVTLETVDMRPWVQDLVGGVTLETVDMWSQLQGLGSRFTMKTVDVWPRFWSGGCSCPGNCGHVTQVSGSGRVSPWKVWMCDPRLRVWGGVSPWRMWICDPRGIVGRGPPWRLWNCEPSCRAWEGVTLETVDVWLQVVSGRDHPGDCSYVTLSIVFGRSPYRLWTCDPRCMV